MNEMNWNKLPAIKPLNKQLKRELIISLVP
ncbi:hypothetical protein SAMN05192574_104569 [Mucilaginibacter gossypiicola]|uniref:Uncharacterized protein n=1 Tax=Mucilaginibacter gossypiicola TaxID=551995 RepID=A0A1H8KDQ4_9SPHI|nr:hypothetical protein SAMN05192574_104569 [Mucilaginibacter gossypiicola]